jgi:cycloeucalenol cycloisomerase
MDAIATDAAGVAASTRGRWFSSNPSKAWGERFFLAYSPVWMIAFGIFQRSRLTESLGDAGNLLATLAIFTPVWLVPALVRDETVLGRPWYRTYWFKFNLWMLLYSGIASYFLTEYFFDVMGMVYNYPHLRWTLDSALLGSGRQRVPVIMYLHAHYFFLTYHTTAVLVMRRIRTSRIGGHATVAAATVLATACFWAWAEIYFTTSPEIADQFRYEDMTWALRWGALFYACYFVASFPMVYRLDEDPAENWTVGRTCIEALATAMMSFVLLDLVTHVTGTRP